MQSNIVIAAFYHFADFPDYAEKRREWLEFCNERGLKGTILMASEGINSTISGSRAGIDALLDFIRADTRFSGLAWKESYADFQPFERMKVRLKSEIVRLGIVNLEPKNFAGTYIKPKDWDEFMAKPGVKIIDTRNDYEVKIGHFAGAINPKTRNFRDFPAWAEENLHLSPETPIGMYCTGGIRCEKSTAYLKTRGFKNVYHLQGGILQYLEDTGNKGKKWQGECFVFDDRVAVNNDLAPTSVGSCPDCGSPLTTDSLKNSRCGDCNKSLI